jgi:hypothetical protein
MKKRIMLVITVALVTAALMLVSALPVLAAPNPDSAAGECGGGPGQTIRGVAKLPGSTREVFGPPGEGVREFCAPGQR